MEKNNFPQPQHNGNANENNISPLSSLNGNANEYWRSGSKEMNALDEKLLEVEHELFSPIINLSSSEDLLFPSTLPFNSFLEDFNNEHNVPLIKEESSPSPPSSEVSPPSPTPDNNQIVVSNEYEQKGLARAVQLLQQQVHELQGELRLARSSKIFMEPSPKMMCMSIWSLPSGQMCECSASFYDFFQLKQNQPVDLDFLTPDEMKEEKRMARIRFARDKPDIKGVSALKTYTSGIGQRMTVKSVYSLLHFEEGSLIQMIFWR